MTVLVTGGAGYIGSHTSFALLDQGIPVVVLDNLSTGVRDQVPADAAFYEGDIADSALLAEIIAKHEVRAVMHFAGSIVVPESVADPIKYYENNTLKSLTLIRACRDNGVASFIFSSTAAVYGEPEQVPVVESCPKSPINPYGWSKLMTEQVLADTSFAHGLKYGVLRYFNVAGADPQGRTGQSTPFATHLIKVACQTSLGQRDKIAVFGTDYDTEDGTCVRDYIHVMDLARAHVQTLQYLEAGGDNVTLNCGYGRGFSVRQVLKSVERMSNKPLPQEDAPRRAGDPAELVADSTAARELLQWVPEHDDLDFIVKTAYEWERHMLKKNQDAAGSAA